MHASVPHVDTLSELFIQGRAPANPKTRSLQYVRREGKEVALDVDKIKDIENFLRALQGFVRERISSDVLFNDIGNQQSKAWRDHMQLSLEMLFQEFYRHNCTPNENDKDRIFLDAASEYIMSGVIKEFNSVFDGGSNRLHLPEWDEDHVGIENAIQLGRRYLLEPRFPHHVLLQERPKVGRLRCLREFDMIELIDNNDTLFTFDVTCSAYKARAMMKNPSYEKPVLRFGSTIRTLHQETDGQKGYKHFAHVNVHCCADGKNPDELQTILQIAGSDTDGQQALLMRLPLLHHVIDIKNSMKRAFKPSRSK